MPMPRVEVTEKTPSRRASDSGFTHESNSCCEAAVSLIKDHISKARKVAQSISCCSHRPTAPMLTHGLHEYTHTHTNTHIV